MRLFINILGIVFVGVALIMAGALPSFSQEKTVRAKIGILVKLADQIIRPNPRIDSKPEILSGSTCTQR